MDKIDLKKTLGGYWKAPAGQFVVIEVPRLNFLMVDGEGNPSTSPDYEAAVGALYATSYTLKFASKVQGRDYVVPEDLFALAEDVMLHRIRLTYEALAEGKTAAGVLRQILEASVS